MRARSTVTAKAIACLAVAAAGSFWFSATAIFLLLRVLGTYWGGSECRPVTPTPLSVRLFRWAWRFEVAAGLSVALARTIVSAAFGSGLTDATTLAALVAVLVVPGPRDVLRDHLVALRRRRRWANCLSTVLPAAATPAVHSFGSGPDGEWAQVRIGQGSTVSELAGKAEALAASLAVDVVRVERHPTNAAWAVLYAMVSDPLTRPAPPWPWADRTSVSIWEPVPVGVDEAGRQVTVTLAEHNLLLGGEPGAGKSVALSQLVAAAALDPGCGLWLLDGKLVELAAWRGGSDGWAGVDIFEALSLLRHVQEVMDSRYRTLLADGRRKIAQGNRLEVVVIDELAHYLTWADKKPRDAFADVLRDVVSRGRAAGIVVIAATQKPSSDVVPTSLRDLFGYRWALRCTTNAASDTILGSGWASQGVSSATIAPAARGVGWLLHESGSPVRLRAHLLDDGAVSGLAARAAALRSSTGSAAGG